jgi:hypothetical protein
MDQFKQILSINIYIMIKSEKPIKGKPQDKHNRKT